LASASPAPAGGGPLALAAAGLAAHESGTLPDRGTRAPHSLNSGARPGRRNGAFVVVHGGKFGAGTRPGPGRTGPRRRGDESARRAGTRPGGRVAGRPPARGRGPNPYPAPAGG
jgi:hypothetical protein